MSNFIQGAIMMGTAVAALFFLRFWKQTGDRLLAVFSLAFALMTLRRVVHLCAGVPETHVHYVYLLRLLPYALIIYAIVNKNSTEQRRRGGPST